MSLISGAGYDSIFNTLESISMDINWRIMPQDCFNVWLCHKTAQRLVKWQFNMILKKVIQNNIIFTPYIFVFRSTLRSQAFNLTFHSDENQGHQGIWLHFARTSVPHWCEI